MPRRNGFTLLEMLVALVIVGLAATLVAVRFSASPEQTLREETQRLALLLEQAIREARVSGAAQAWSADAAGYRFWTRDGGGEWQPHPDALYRPRAFPEGVRLDGAKREDIRLTEGERLVFQPRTASPFTITTASAAGRFEIRGDPLGRVTIHEQTSSTER